MGFLILQESGMFIPRAHGIKDNTAVTVLSIGGGGGGGDGYLGSKPNSDGTISGSGGKSGCAGQAYSYGGGGGGGGGFGAGGGGGGGYFSSSGDSAASGGGGGGGQVIMKTVAIEDAEEAIPVTIAQRVNTDGQSTSFGSYVTAIGGGRGADGSTKDSKGGLGAGLNNDGGKGPYPATNYYGSGGGGGGGGYQIGLFVTGGKGGNGGCQGLGNTSPLRYPSAGEICGGGGGGGTGGSGSSVTKQTGGDGGKFGGGAGATVGGGSSDKAAAKDGYTYLHSGLENSGAILLFW